MKAIAVVACTCGLLCGCAVETGGPSAERQPSVAEHAEGAEHAAGETPSGECTSAVLDEDIFAEPGASANDAAVSFSALRIDRLPEWSLAALQPAFERVRDERFLCDPKRPSFARRLTWLDPTKGCEMRAELVGSKLAEWGYARPYKLFLFGNMQVATPNTPSGIAAWGWHVASAVRVGDRAYVFDAAVEPRRPLRLDEWAQRLVSSVDELKAAVCDYAAFQPFSTCFGGPVWATNTALYFEQSFFADEWKLQLSLGRDPEQTLGEAPPWSF